MAPTLGRYRTLSLSQKVLLHSAGTQDCGRDAVLDGGLRESLSLRGPLNRDLNEGTEGV